MFGTTATDAGNEQPSFPGEVPPLGGNTEEASHGLAQLYGPRSRWLPRANTHRCVSGRSHETRFKERSGVLPETVSRFPHSVRAACSTLGSASRAPQEVL